MRLRSRLIVLLLVLLPLQLCWAAVGSFCAELEPRHAPQPISAHCCDHTQAKPVKEQGVAVDQTDGKGLCEACPSHAWASAAQLHTVVSPRMGVRIVPGESRFAPLAWVERPERPQWMAQA